MSENSARQITVSSFMDNVSINFTDGRTLQLSETEGKELALALNTHFARRFAEQLRRENGL